MDSAISESLPAMISPTGIRKGIETMADLETGMRIPGIVTNVTAFGAFVDIGVHQDGLVHISELADKFVKDPAEVVKVHQKVRVTVMSVDTERKRIALSMKTVPGEGDPARKKPPKDSSSRKKAKDKDRPFNNPFADIFGKIG